MACTDETDPLLQQGGCGKGLVGQHKLECGLPLEIEVACEEYLQIHVFVEKVKTITK